MCILNLIDCLLFVLKNWIDILNCTENVGNDSVENCIVIVMFKPLP